MIHGIDDVALAEFCDDQVSAARINPVDDGPGEETRGETPGESPENPEKPIGGSGNSNSSTRVTTPPDCWTGWAIASSTPGRSGAPRLSRQGARGFSAAAPSRPQIRCTVRWPSRSN